MVWLLIICTFLALGLVGKIFKKTTVNDVKKNSETDVVDKISVEYGGRQFGLVVVVRDEEVVDGEMKAESLPFKIMDGKVLMSDKHPFSFH